MPWIRIRGVKGLVYEPPKQRRNRRKHNCRDCHSCQFCSDMRCAACRRKKTAPACRRAKGRK